MLSKSQIKLIRSLQQKKCRDSSQLFVVEGQKMISELTKSHPHLLQQVICTSNFDVNKLNLPIEIEFIDQKTFNALSGMTTPQGIMGIFKQIDLEYIPAVFTLILDDVQDPGNMGTILRLADWFGITQIVCSKNCVDIFNSKVVQASMGSIFRVRVAYMDLIPLLAETKLPVYGALLEGENVYKKNIKKEGFLIMGNEGNGISKAVANFITEALFIPQFGGGESLNVSMATAVLLSEFSRL